METSQPDDSQIPSPDIEPIRFRAGKKRKAYRRRSTTDDDEVSAAGGPLAVQPGVAASPQDAEATRGIDEGAIIEDVEAPEDAEESAVAAALRLRNARRAGRLRGVGFRSEGRPGEEEAEQALILRDQEGGPAGPEKEGPVGGISNRFMHQTGLLTILDDKHMNAYIASRLASRNTAPSGSPPSSSSTAAAAATAAAASSETRNGSQVLHDNASSSSASAPVPNNHNKLRDQPARQGKLVEVDIPDDIRDRLNETNKRRRTEKPNKQQPARRGRNRRTSDDIARDNLVEQFLRENRLDVYDFPSTSTHPSTTLGTGTSAAASTAAAPGTDPSADDRLAEQFRQQYLDEQALRRKKKRPPGQQQQLLQQRQQAGDVLKGPKLGGSRNVRAAMRDILLQQEKEKKK